MTERKHMTVRQFEALEIFKKCGSLTQGAQEMGIKRQSFTALVRKAQASSGIVDISSDTVAGTIGPEALDPDLTIPPAIEPQIHHYENKDYDFTGQVNQTSLNRLWLILAFAAIVTVVVIFSGW